ncbi:MAG: dihydrofolate reductase family protein [Actinomycetota bacterium]|nr:dihydrofolate reductase family protein [Actinomycetota bacterium]
MGRIVSNFFISLDGVVESPDQWHFPYFNEEMGAIIGEGIAGCAAFLMGRVLYDEWSAYWPAHARTEPEQAQETADDFARFINDIPKYVVSNTLGEATWNNTTVISGDVAGELREVKDRTDGNIVMSGSATLVRWLLAKGLLDELNLLLHPIAVGHGRRLFEDTPTHRLQLVRHAALTTGVLSLSYAPAPD